ncbi:hypothetical protein BAE44_0013467 [Dichanthelium oligosanthes]|uniref:Uncharacterized protein n=1 Tax=Dichanthelium oligosanthes TaxID=888268 RepID=A0A1E5VK81_9POAL|nr:hypothetical protein BAE44_0013467 [Dichanthelium oligosanthes]
MEAQVAAPHHHHHHHHHHQKAANLARTFTKLLRRKRADAAAAEAPEAPAKLKLSGNLAAAYSFDAFFRNATEKKAAAAGGGGGAGAGAGRPVPGDVTPEAAADSLLATLFAGVSAVKAAYAQLQLAQFPYDAEAIQSADAAVASLTAELRAERALEARLHPGRTLASLDDLHLSGLNPTHYLTALRHTVKSIRSFAKSMLNSMQSAGWDLAAAAAAVHPGVPLQRPGDTRFVFESYVAMKMFANFHRRDFNFSFLDEREFYDRRRFFEEFTELKAEPASAFLDVRNPRWGGFGKFLRAKYLSLVHARMETAFFGRLEQRGIVSAGPGFPESSWFAEFAEMARRVWLLHCLFFAFDGGAEEDGASIFQVRTGARFSEVYMESVSDGRAADDAAAAAVADDRVVGFTVLPGFRVGRTLIQCRVYLTRPARRP